MKELFRRGESGPASSARSRGSLEPTQGGHRESPQRAPREGCLRVPGLWDILNPNQREGPPRSLHLCTGAWLTAVPGWRLLMAPTQSVPRGHGGSFDEAYQSIPVLPAVSWEGNWSYITPTSV